MATAMMGRAAGAARSRAAAKAGRAGSRAAKARAGAKGGAARKGKVVRGGRYEMALERGSYAGKSTQLGGGGRFAALVDDIAAQRKIPKSRAKKIAAKIGTKKYGGAKMKAMARAGRARANAQRGGGRAAATRAATS